MRYLLFLTGRRSKDILTMLTPKVIELHYLHLLFFEFNLDTIH